MAQVLALKNTQGRPKDKTLFKKETVIPDQMTVKRRVLTAEELKKRSDKVTFILEDLRQRHTMDSLACSLGISRPYLYQIGQTPYKIDDNLLSKLEYLYKNQDVIKPPKSEKERLEEQVQSLTLQLETMKRDYEKEIARMKETIQNLNLLVSTLSSAQQSKK